MSATRQIMLDTETTGLEWRQGERVIEIGCVELINRKLTGRHFHRYLNPERDIDEGARAVHGISSGDLASAPRFADIAADMLAFLGFKVAGTIVAGGVNAAGAIRKKRAVLARARRLGAALVK